MIDMNNRTQKHNVNSIVRPLPMSLREAAQHGWDQLDIIIVTGDAYVDHPGFGAGLIGRVLEDAGYSVGIIAQPNWDMVDDFTKLGKPRLFFAVTAGNTDSMVANYTPSLKPRKKDVYAPGGRPGLRPDRASIVYTNRIRQAYPDTTIVLGGVEASLRRFAHYDFQTDRVRKSILADAPADILVYGMGETQTVEISRRLASGQDIKQITDIPGTAWKMKVKEWKERKGNIPDIIEMGSYTEVSSDKRAFASSFAAMYHEQDPIHGRCLIQPHPKTVIVQNPPAKPLTPNELDHVYELPFTRDTHPSYRESVPGLEPVKFSITTHRGCFGSCAFCAITQHQGRIIASRSIDSIVREATRMTRLKDFKGIINGVGGPSANMYAMKCTQWDKKGTCSNRYCLYPEPCPSLDTDHSKNIEMLEQLRQIPGISKVFIGYGVRYDLALLQPDYITYLCKYHISGQLGVAPEHYSDKITDIMGKPPRAVFEKFANLFTKINKEIGKEQYLNTYLMSGHPGSTMQDMVETAEYIRDTGRYSKQVQDFTPTPMTTATCMFHTGIDPFTGKDIHVTTSRREKKIQRALLQYRDPRNQPLVYEGLKIANRLDLVGNTWKCLINRKGRTQK